MTSGTSIFGHLTQFRTRLRTSGLSHKPPIEELPLRSELFSADQMEQHGRALAAAHRLTPRRARDALLPRLAANESALIGVCKRMTAAVRIVFRREFLPAALRYATAACEIGRSSFSLARLYRR